MVIKHNNKQAYIGRGGDHPGRWIYCLVGGGLVESDETGKRHGQFKSRAQAAHAFVKDCSILPVEERKFEVVVDPIPDGVTVEQVIGLSRYFDNKQTADLVAKACQQRARKYSNPNYWSPYEPGVRFSVREL